MNSGNSVEDTRTTTKENTQAASNLAAFQISAFRLLQSGSGKAVRFVCLLCCVLVALATLFNYSQAHQLQLELSKRRLLEISLQDLIVQSTALAHLSDHHTYEIKLGLENRGYASPQELLNQLAARLAVIETVGEPLGLIKSATILREHLMAMDQQLDQLGRPNSHRIERWFVELGIFNATLKNEANASDKKFEALQRNNLILTLIVLLLSTVLISFIVWRQSKIRQRFTKELHHLSNQAQTDSLTGLLNRRGWQDVSSLYSRKMQKENQVQGSVAILDIDYFKQYKDTYGQEAGDLRLRDFAESLKSNFRPEDLIARIGGEEFALLLPNCTAEDALRIVDRLRLNGKCKVGFSAGICSIAHNDGIERTMARADHALYQARSKGRNCTCLGTIR